MSNKKGHHILKAAKIKQLLGSVSAFLKVEKTIASDWQIEEGDRVQLDMDAITRHPGYKHMLPAYQKFCEENRDTIFTVEYDTALRHGLVQFKEDTSEPKWLFYIGDLKKIQENST